MKKFLVLAATMALGACASQPDDIATSYVSSLQYKNYDCDQIAMEMARVERRVGELHARLKKKADDDAGQTAVGLVLFWPALFFLEGGDGPEAQEYSRLKGEYDALEQVAVEKKCTVNSVQQEPKAEEPAAGS